MSEIYTSELSTPLGFLRICASDDAITSVRFNDAPQEVNENELSREAYRQLEEYFAGRRQHFELCLAPTGTEFQKSVWSALLKTKFGEKKSYLDIANAIGNPKACRAVGSANGKNPIAIIIPCHRIVGANGSLTGYAGGLNRKSFLLNLETA